MVRASVRWMKAAVAELSCSSVLIWRHPYSLGFRSTAVLPNAFYVRRHSRDDGLDIHDSD